MAGWARAAGLSVAELTDFSAQPRRRGPDRLPLAARATNRIPDERSQRPPHQPADRPSARRFEVSFEFFPPKTDVMEERFWESVHKLAPLNPRFVSVTYGAGGSTRERTLRMVSQIKAETGVDAAAHLTCVGAIARRGRPGGARLQDRRHQAHRGAARRSAGGRRQAVRAASRGLHERRRTRRRHPPHRRFRHLGRRLSRKASADRRTGTPRSTI